MLGISRIVASRMITPPTRPFCMKLGICSLRALISRSIRRMLTLRSPRSLGHNLWFQSPMPVMPSMLPMRAGAACMTFSMARMLWARCHLLVDMSAGAVRGSWRGRACFWTTLFLLRAHLMQMRGAIMFRMGGSLLMNGRSKALKSSWAIRGTRRRLTVFY